MLTTIQRSALLAHSARAMYELVNDVDSYPQFMDGCVGARVLEQGDNEMVASLTLSKGGIKQTFTTRNILHPYEKIELQLVDGPFKRLHGVWSFKPLAENACKVSLELSFEFSNILVNIASSSLFTHVANHMVDAFSRRATAVYGKTA